MYEIYSLKESDDWDRIISEVNSDVYYTSGYCRVFEEKGDGTAYLFVYRDKGITIIYPFLKRIIDLPFADMEEDYFDIVTPYGYGGPLCSEKAPETGILQNFSKEFNDYCIKNNIASEFIRFHPMIGNYRLCSEIMEVDFNRKTVYMDLSQSEEEIWNDMSSGNRRKVRVAQENDVTIEKVSIDKNALDIFHNLYEMTMKKNHADSYYYFDKKFFYNMHEYLNGMASIFFAKIKNKIISGSFILHYDRYLHYHFNASDSQYLSYRPNNLLNYEIALWGHRQGYKIFHLGGGHASGEDELFRFKKNFSKSKLFDFYIGKRIHNPKAYSLLCEKWEKHFQKTNQEINIRYFPLYRYIETK